MLIDIWLDGSNLHQACTLLTVLAWIFPRVHAPVTLDEATRSGVKIQKMTPQGKTRQDANGFENAPGTSRVPIGVRTAQNTHRLCREYADRSNAQTTNQNFPPNQTRVLVNGENFW